MIGYKNHIESNLKELKKHLNSYYETKDPEDLHKLRVHIKKIRSLCYWSANTNEQEIRSALKPLKRLFREAGEIRSILLITHLLKTHQIKASQIIKAEQKNLKLSTRVFELHYWLYQKDIDHATHALKKLIVEPKTKKVIRSIYKNSKYISHSFKQKDSKIEWHELRKMIKELIYNAEVIKDNSKKNLSFDFNYAHEIQHKLGNWNDLISTQHLLKNYFKSTEPRIRKLNIQLLELETDIKINVSEFYNKITLFR